MIVVRPFGEGDEQQIGKIASRAFPRLGLARLAIDKSLREDTVREAYRREAQEYARRVSTGDKDIEILVAQDEDAIAGYIVLGVNADWSEVFGFRWASIVSLAVDPDFWGGAVGSKLVDEGLKVLREKKVRHVEVLTDQNNIAAIRVYEKNGFRVIYSGVTLSQYLDG
jgi:ribosomal protein S18 acetylase RimI-like enzyme